MRTLFAWLAHFYTSLGFVCAAGIVVLIVRGDDVSLRLAFGLMMVATAIDATDGWLARAARVHEVLPNFDGSALDNLIDFHTYTSLPLFLLWRVGTITDGLAWILLLPLVSRMTTRLDAPRPLRNLAAFESSGLGTAAVVVSAPVPAPVSR